MVLVAEPKRRTPMHHKKRTGQHHKQTKHYTKTYWPYLPLLLIVGLGFVVSTLWSSRQHSVLGYATAISPSSLLQATNQDRQDSRVADLRLNTQLSNAAQAKALDMVHNNYWSHVSPSGRQPWQFIAAAGYSFGAAGENLEYGLGASSQVVAAWMGSSEHRANVLNAQFTDVGFGIANAPDFRGAGPQTIVVAMYASPASSGATVGSGQPQVLGAQDSRSVSRMAVLVKNDAPWSLFVVGLFAGLSVGIFVVRHGLLWRRVLVRGEVFVVKYHLLDVLLLSVGVAGFILTRNAGTIH